MHFTPIDLRYDYHREIYELFLFGFLPLTSCFLVTFPDRQAPLL